MYINKRMLTNCFSNGVLPNWRFKAVALHYYTSLLPNIWKETTWRNEQCKQVSERLKTAHTGKRMNIND